MSEKQPAATGDTDVVVMRAQEAPAEAHEEQDCAHDNAAVGMKTAPLKMAERVASAPVTAADVQAAVRGSRGWTLRALAG
jgi:hypothetical protein